MTKSFCLCYDFNPRSPHGERPSAGLRTQYFPFISIHAPRTGSDRTGNTQVKARFGFQSTLPARGATTVRGAIDEVYEFQSTLPARGATASSAIFRRSQWISIHAPRTGSDEAVLEGLLFTCQFQSTLPARGATGFSPGAAPPPNHFNPRSPHGERRLDFSGVHRAVISIHAPRTGSDGVATEGYPLRNGISIHAPRTGSDDRWMDNDYDQHPFQSTLPARGATRRPTRTATSGRPISIHAPRTGSDSPAPAALRPSLYFNPRSPHGERPLIDSRPAAERNFNPRSPHGERQGTAENPETSPKNFNPRSPHGERRRRIADGTGRD